MNTPSCAGATPSSGTLLPPSWLSRRVPLLCSGDDRCRTAPIEAQDTLLLTDRSGHTHALDTASGAERWQHATGQRITTAPTVHQGHAFVATWTPHHLVCLNLATGQEEWRGRAAGALTTRPFVVGDIVYAADRTGTLTGWSMDSGRRILQVTDLLWDPDTQGDPIVHGHILYVTTRRGAVRAVQLPNPTHRFPAVRGAPSSTHARPAILPTGPAVPRVPVRGMAVGRIVHGLASGGGGVARRRKTVAESLAEALRLRQEAKLAEARGASTPAPRAPARPKPKRPRDPEAEQARLAAHGEKLLKRQEAEQAREAQRIEAELAKRQAQRQRDAEREERERQRALKEQEKTQRQQQLLSLQHDAEQRTQSLAARLRDLDSVVAHRLDGLEKWHPRVERELLAHGAQGLAAVVEDLQRRTPVPEGCRGEVEAAYAPEARQVVVNLDLPELRQIPAVTSYRFVAARAEIIPQPRKDAERYDLYRTLVARLALRALDEVFAATPAALVDSIVLNGFVPTVDPATGRSVRPCVVSVVAARQDVQALVLDAPAFDAQRCLRAIGATVSEHPHDLEAVPPVVDPDLSRYRITADAAAVTGLDSRPDLLQMDPFAFERLVRQLFEAMGYDTWRTQGSRDEGVDAVAVKRDAVAATVFAIQAKRTKNHVPVETVRALSGTMHDVNASHGVLVTTSWYGKSSTDFANRNRIYLIDGRNLKALLLEHLGIDALIGLPKVPPGWIPGDVA